MKQAVLIIAGNNEFSRGIFDDAKKDGGFDEELLEDVKDENSFIIKTEVVRGEIAFRKALVDLVEGDDEEEKLEITDWELI